MALSFSSWGADRLTLERAVEIAEKNQPRVLAATYRANAAAALPQQLRARTLPQMDGLITGSLANHGTRLGIGGPNAPDLFSRVGLGFSVTHVFTDFGRTGLQVESARNSAFA